MLLALVAAREDDSILFFSKFSQTYQNIASLRLSADPSTVVKYSICAEIKATSAQALRVFKGASSFQQLLERRSNCKIDWYSHTWLIGFKCTLTWLSVCCVSLIMCTMEAFDGSVYDLWVSSSAEWHAVYLMLSVSSGSNAIQRSNFQFCCSLTICMDQCVQMRLGSVCRADQMQSNGPTFSFAVRLRWHCRRERRSVRSRWAVNVRRIWTWQ